MINILQNKDLRHKSDKGEMARLEDMVTAIIKTFERQESLQRLVASIKTYYSRLPILIADDSRRPSKIEGAVCYPMPFDSGVSAGRNFLLSKVQTPFFLLLDDDFVFSPKTRVDLLLATIRKSDIDLLAGDVFYRKRNSLKHYAGSLETDPDGTLRWINRHKGVIEGCHVYDIVHNFFLADTEKVKRIGWDSDLKIGEHEDFFLRAREHLIVALRPGIEVINTEDSNPYYRSYRGRRDDYFKRFLRKHGLRRYVNRHGETEIDLARSG